MATYWWICRYVKAMGEFGRPFVRVSAFESYHDDLTKEGAKWRYEEIAGNRCLVRAEMSDALAQTIALDVNCLPLPLKRLDQTLGELSPQARSTLQDLAVEMGYSLTEIRNRLGNNVATVTLGQLLRFLASRRIKPRYSDDKTDVVFDGPVIPLRQTLVDELEQRVSADAVSR